MSKAGSWRVWRRGGSGQAYLLYGLMTLPFGIFTHLFAEAGAASFAPPPSFWLNHAYLGVIAFAGFFGAKYLLANYLSGSLLRAAALRADLPFQAKGWRFYALAYAWQLGFFGLTMAVEGDPIAHGDWILGSASAVALAAVGSAVLAFLAHRIESVSSGSYLRRERRRLTQYRCLQLLTQLCSQLFYSGYATVVGNRPPPLSFA